MVLLRLVLTFSCVQGRIALLDHRLEVEWLAPVRLSLLLAVVSVQSVLLLLSARGVSLRSASLCLQVRPIFRLRVSGIFLRWVFAFCIRRVGLQVCAQW